MSNDGSSERGPWFVPLMVALISALGLAAAAAIPKLLDTEPPPPVGTSRASASPSTPNGIKTNSGAPNIAGSYYLDPDNKGRIIVLSATGEDRYDIYEKEPAPWPFTGTVAWKGESFSGPAKSDSGNKMYITLLPVGSGRLDAEFAFLTEAGQPSDRKDPHTLVPVG